MSSDWVLSRTWALVRISKVVWTQARSPTQSTYLAPQMLRMIQVTSRGENPGPAFMEELTGAVMDDVGEAVEGQMLRAKQIWDPEHLLPT